MMASTARCALTGPKACADMDESTYHHWGAIDDGWMCSLCAAEVLPFANVSHFSHLSPFADDSSVSVSMGTKQLEPDALKCLSFNARSIMNKGEDLINCVTRK